MSMTDVIREGYARYGRRDFDLVDELFAEDMRWNVPGPHGPLQGRAAVRGFFEGLAAQFASHTIRLDDAVETPDRVICFVTHTLVPQGQEPVEIEAVHDWHVADGRFVALREYADTLAFAIVTGAIPADALAQPA
jgi:ketosteroid isomerase-like protein